MAKTQFVLFDGEERIALLPFTFTRSVSEIRIGILKIHEKWDTILKGTCSILSVPYLQTKYPQCSQSDSIVYINGSVLPDNIVVDSILYLKKGQVLQDISGKIIAFHTEEKISSPNLVHTFVNKFQKITFEGTYTSIRHPWDIFTYNGAQIQADVKLLQLEPNGHLLEKDNKILHPENIYIQEGATATWAMINSDKGPVYLGKESEVMEGAIIKGNTALCEHATIKMGAKIYGDTTIGPHSKVGGEIGNSVIFGYSNKGHDGYLGNSVLGEWCNLGADTNNSNLKNNYSTVKVWSYEEYKEINTGLQFCGLLMGDHSKCGINTMFNTGTVVGVSANIFGGGFPPKFIPSFTWGGSDKLLNYDFEKAIQTAEKVMGRRNIQLTPTDIEILREIFHSTEINRSKLSI